MKWISSQRCPPIYVHLNNVWFNKTTKEEYVATPAGWQGKDRVIPYGVKFRLLGVQELSKTL